MRYAFADFEVDLQLFELRRGGRRVHLEPKVFDLLVFLLEHADRVVTKRELLDAVWADEHVVEAVLPTAVRRLRSALGQEATADTPIATERGRGYRFAAPVQRFGVPEAKGPEPAPALFPRERGTDVVTLDDDEPLVGRAPVVAELVRVLDSAAVERRRPRMRLVSGLPGVGRTRLLSELVEIARSRRLPVFSTRGRAGAPELWPWSALVRQIVDGLDDGARAALPRPLRRELSLLAPALRSGDTIPPGPVQGREPLVVADAVRSLLALASPDFAGLLVLDDLELFDGASLEVLRALAEEETRRPLLVASAREPLERGAPLARLVEQLERGEREERVPLQPLGADETRAYLRAARTSDVPEAVAQHVNRLTAGLPAVLRACIRAWPPNALDTLPGAQLLRLPPAAYEPARRWIAALPEDARSLLQVASVLGERFDLGLLRAVSGRDAEHVLGAIEQATEIGVLQPDDAQPQGHRFVLGYLRDALYEDLRPVERRPLHRAAAEALEQRAELAGDDALTHVLAHHLWNALPGVPVDKAVTFNARAAAQLAQAAQWSDAAIHYGRALEALGYAPRQDLRASAELLLELGLCQRAAGDDEAARASLDQAVKLASRIEGADALLERARAELSR